jgi:hypothetical protein
MKRRILFLEKEIYTRKKSNGARKEEHFALEPGFSNTTEVVINHTSQKINNKTIGKETNYLKSKNLLLH